MLVSLLIPVFSESASLRDTVEILAATLSGIEFEILLLVHKDSDQQCLETCAELAREWPRVRVEMQRRYPGQGWAYREGFDAATGTHLLLMNADLETDPHDARRLIETMVERDLDLVVASRWMKGGGVDVLSYGPLRALTSWLFQRIVGRLARAPVHDLTFAYKIGTRRLFRSFEWTGTGHELAMETTLRPILAGCRVGEIPTRWSGRRDGVSHQPFRRNLRHAALAAQLLWQHARGRHV
jgi:glycosyltransferase involved in cell wall biosynthesis